MTIYTCSHCKNEYHNRSEWITHVVNNRCKIMINMNKIKKVIIHECQICKKKFDRKYTHDRHVKNIHGGQIKNRKYNNVNDDINIDDNNVNTNDNNNNNVNTNDNSAHTNDDNANTSDNNNNNKTPGKYKKKRKSVVLRNVVWNTYMGDENKKGKCLCCSQEDITILNFICGHVIAESKGGDTTIKNLRPVCNLCNLSMGTENMEDFIRHQGLKKNPNWNGYKIKEQNSNILTNIIIELVNIAKKSENSYLNEENRDKIADLVNKILIPNENIMNELKHSLDIKNKDLSSTKNIQTNKTEKQLKEILTFLLDEIQKIKRIDKKKYDSIKTLIDEKHELIELRIIITTLTEALYFDKEINNEILSNEIIQQKELEGKIVEMFPIIPKIFYQMTLT